MLTRSLLVVLFLRGACAQDQLPNCTNHKDDCATNVFIQKPCAATCGAGALSHGPQKHLDDSVRKAPVSTPSVALVSGAVSPVEISLKWEPSPPFDGASPPSKIDETLEISLHVFVPAERALQAALCHIRIRVEHLQWAEFPLQAVLEDLRDVSKKRYDSAIGIVKEKRDNFNGTVLIFNFMLNEENLAEINDHAPEPLIRAELLQCEASCTGYVASCKSDSCTVLMRDLIKP